jgi:Tfp pilus assembly protein PilE
LLEYTPTDNDRTIEHIYVGDKRVAQRVKDTYVPPALTSTTLTANPVTASCGSNTTLAATVNPAAAQRTYRVRATPIGAQLTGDTQCGTLTLNQAGLRTESGTGTVNDCW